MNFIIQKFISGITKDDINKFALKNNIVLTSEEQDIFYDIIKHHYQKLLCGNDEEIIKELKVRLTDDKFNKVINLYNIYKEKFKLYL